MPSVLIIESKDEDDPGSEGMFVKHMLNLMGVTNKYYKIHSKTQFIKIISGNLTDVKVIHIATHGEYRQISISQAKKFTGFWTPCGAVTMEDIRCANISLSGKTIISTACFSGQKVPRNAFKNTTGCKHYIAPIKDPNFYNAALMCHIFYHKHLALKRSAREAFSQYADRYKNPHVFCLI